MNFIYFFLLSSCIDSPKELPPSRLEVASKSMMIQYGKLKGFLIEKGAPQHIILWQVNELTEVVKTCAQRQTPMNSKALVITGHVDLAHSYLKINHNPTPLKCN